MPLVFKLCKAIRNSLTFIARQKGNSICSYGDVIGLLFKCGRDFVLIVGNKQRTASHPLDSSSMWRLVLVDSPNAASLCCNKATEPRLGRNQLSESLNCSSNYISNSSKQAEIIPWLHCCVYREKQRKHCRSQIAILSFLLFLLSCCPIM
jgi:hypothetical protein